MPWPQEIKSCFNSQSTKKSHADQDMGHILGSPMLDVALGDVTALDDVLRDMGSCLRAVSTDYQLLQWDNKLPPEVPTDWVQCDRCKKWRRLPWHVSVCVQLVESAAERPPELTIFARLLFVRLMSTRFLILGSAI